jgi:hypothetical protein
VLKKGLNSPDRGLGLPSADKDTTSLRIDILLEERPNPRVISNTDSHMAKSNTPPFILFKLVIFRQLTAEKQKKVFLAKFYPHLTS